MSNVIRLVVCQLECHPAFYRDRLACLEEPFMPASYETSLSYLGGFGIPITDIQERTRDEYLQWHRKRLRSLLSHPLLNEDVPCVIVFPEGSIPLNCLKILYEFAKDKKATIVAGSHTILDTIEAKQIYSDFGKDELFDKRHKHNNDVTFIFANDKIHSRKKQGISPFDRIDMTGLNKHKITIHPIPIAVGESTIKMATLICADALQLPNIKGDYDIVSIISYNQDVEYFNSFIGTQVGNNKVVIYCNDGKFGGSTVNIPIDNRPVSWFFEAPLNGKLPKGDAILIIDVPTSGLATQVGIMNPAPQKSVKLFASITYSSSLKKDQEVSKELAEINEITDNNVRKNRIGAILKKREYNPNQKYRLDCLEEFARTGVDSKDKWAAYGVDVLLNLSSLEYLESTFAKDCTDKLVQQFIEGQLEPDSSAALQSYLKTCKSKIHQTKMPATNYFRKQTYGKDDYVNREDEVATLLSFLDSENDFLVEITGLPQIGKSSTINKTLARTSSERIKKIELQESSSDKYIISEIASLEKRDLRQTELDKEPLSLLDKTISDWDVIWFENCQQLLISGQWKSDKIKELINRIILVSIQKKVKLIFETIFKIPFDLRDPSQLRRMRISGFERKIEKHGIAILENQIRRLSQKPGDIASEVKKQLVKDMGGHPLAIIFCVDAIYDEGLTAVRKAIKQGGGFYRKVTNRILSMVTLSSDEKQILRMLSGCRVEVHRDAVASSCDFPVTEAISNLGRQCLIEVVTSNTIRLSGVLRNRFRFNDLDSSIRKRLHKNATKMYSQMANQHPHRIIYAVEAEYHAAAIDQSPIITTGLIDGQFAAAKQFYDAHDFRKARNALSPLIAAGETNEILRLSCLIDAQLGDIDSALNKAEKILFRNPSDNHLFFVLGKTTLTQSRPEYGDTLVQIGRRVGVSETKVSLLEGRIALRRRDFETAEECFKQSITATRTDPWAYYYLGTTYIRIGEIQDAIDVLYSGDKYLSENPRIRGNARNAIRTKLGVAYVLNGDLEPASLILKSCLKKDPNHPEILYATWILKVRKEGVEKAEEALEEFRAAKPKKWERGSYHLYFGIFLKALDKMHEACEHFELAHRYDRSNVYMMIQYADCLYNLALTEKNKPDRELSDTLSLRCAKIVRRIFEFDPDNPFAENIQIDLYYEFDIQLSKLQD